MQFYLFFKMRFQIKNMITNICILSNGPLIIYNEKLFKAIVLLSFQFFF